MRVPAFSMSFSMAVVTAVLASVRHALGDHRM